MTMNTPAATPAPKSSRKGAKTDPSANPISGSAPKGSESTPPVIPPAPSRSALFIADLRRVKNGANKSKGDPRKGGNPARIKNGPLVDTLSRIIAECNDASFTTVSFVDAWGMKGSASPTDIMRGVLFNDRAAFGVDIASLRAAE